MDELRNAVTASVSAGIRPKKDVEIDVIGFFFLFGFWGLCTGVKLKDLIIILNVAI